MANNKNKLVIIAGTVLVLALVGVTVLLLTEKQTKNWYRNFNWKRKTWKTNIHALHNSMTN